MRRLLVLAGIGGALLALTACSATASSATSAGAHSRPAARHPASASYSSVNWEMPLTDAHRTTLAGVRRRLGTAPALPDDHSLTLSEVWATGAPGAVAALEFSVRGQRGEVTIEEQIATNFESPLKLFRTQLREIKVGKAALRYVNGRPAFVAWPRTDVIKRNPTLVEFFDHRLDITLLSTTLSPAAVLAIARTIGA